MPLAGGERRSTRPTPRECRVTGVARQGENSSKTSPRLRTDRLRRSVREPNRYAVFIIRRIGEPKDYVVQIRTDPGDIVKGESLIDDSPISYGSLKFSPEWDSLRTDPRFEKIVAALAPKPTGK